MRSLILQASSSSSDEEEDTLIRPDAGPEDISISVGSDSSESDEQREVSACHPRNRRRMTAAIHNMVILTNANYGCRCSSLSCMPFD